MMNFGHQLTLALSRTAHEEGMVREQTELLGYLNGTLNFGTVLEQRLAWQRKFRASLVDSSISRTTEDYARAGAFLTKALRKCLDEWICTGFDRNGLETPQARVLGDRRSETKTARLIKDWLLENPGSHIVLEDGQILDVFAPEHDVSVVQGTPIAESQHEVGRLLVRFMRSSVKHALAKCANLRCDQAYYVRNKPRQLYKGKTFCANCRSSDLTRKWVSRNMEAIEQLAERRPKHSVNEKEAYATR
jgi:hypothetical protein